MGAGQKTWEQDKKHFEKLFLKTLQKIKHTR